MKPLTDEMKNYIQYGTEDRRWEFKPSTSWVKEEKSIKFEIVKTCIALSNTINGGFIVIGIKQKRSRSKGVVFERKGLSKEQFDTFNNEDDIGRFLNGKTNQAINFEIFGGGLSIHKYKKRFILIRIYESLQPLPVVCLFDSMSSNPHCRLEKGVLYIRSKSNPIESRAIETNEEWDEMIRRLLSRKEKILNTDLKILCSNIKSKKPRKIIKRSPTHFNFTEYDKILKRDKL
ncbi:MAG: ATP-binding protein [Patescibacteria group bacterium]